LVIPSKERMSTKEETLSYRNERSLASYILREKNVRILCLRTRRERKDLEGMKITIKEKTREGGKLDYLQRRASNLQGGEPLKMESLSGENMGERSGLKKGVN